METQLIILSYRDRAAQYGLDETDVREFVDLGLLHAAPGAPDSLQEEPDHIARLARLHHELGLSKDSLEVIMAMRHRLEQLQRELLQQRARVRQLEMFPHGSGPTLDLDLR